MMLGVQAWLEGAGAKQDGVDAAANKGEDTATSWSWS